MVSMNSSAAPKDRISGRAISTQTVRTSAPNRPPMNEAENAALSARAAWPFLASGKPSRIVACEADDPGIPMRIEAKVSDVDRTGRMPISIASASVGSMP